MVIALIFLLNNVTVQGVAFFTPTIVRTLYPHYTTVKQQQVTSYPYWSGACKSPQLAKQTGTAAENRYFAIFFLVVFCVFIPYLSMKFKKRGLFMMISAPVMVCGYIMFLASNNPNVK